jgi:hypothetical protein
MSYSKATKKDEQDLKEYQTKKAVVQEEPGKVNIEGLKTALKENDVSFDQFVNSDETFRKRALKDKYSELKLKHGWLFDQPIKADV